MKKALLVLALASTLVLGGCVKKTTSNSSNSGDSTSKSDSASVSASDSASTSTSTSVDPEAAYKVSEEEFVDFFVNKLGNATLTQTNEKGVVTEVGTYDGNYAERNGEDDSFGKYHRYYSADAKGVLMEFEVDTSTGAISTVYDPMDLGTSVGSSYEAFAGDCLYYDFGFASMLSMYPQLKEMDETLYCMYLSKSDLTACLRSLYQSLTYDALTHSYKTPMAPNLVGELVSTSLYYENHAFLKALIPYSDMDGTTITTLTVSELGTSKITLPSGAGDAFSYHTIRFYDSDKTTLLAMKRVQDKGTVSYNGGYRKTPSGDGAAYALSGFALSGTSTVLGDAFYSSITADNDLVAVWSTVKNETIYSFDTTTNTLSLKGVEKIGTLVIPSTFTVSDVSYPVEKMSLNNLKDVTEMSLPTSLISITWNTATAERLSNVEFKVSSDSPYLAVTDGALINKHTNVLYSYYKGNTASSYVVPSNIVSIFDYAFAGSHLSSVDLSKSYVTDLGVGVFEHGDYLKEVTLPTGLKTIGDSCFEYCYHLNKINLESTALTSIGKAAFEDAYDLTAVSFPSSLTAIKASAFVKTGLHSVALTGNLKTLGNFAFAGCPGLTSVTTPSSYDNPSLLAGYGIFNNDTALTDFVIPSSVTSIGTNCFMGCTNYAFNLPSSLLTIKDSAFASTLGPKTLTVPSSVTAIGASAFSKVKNLTSVSLSGTTITELNESVFEGCANLASVTVPSSLVTLDTKCFAYTGLTSFTITENMTFAADSFLGCPNISITSLNPNIVFDASGHFYYDKDSTTLKGYVGSSTSYKAPATLTTLGDNIFSSNTNLTTLDLSAVASSGLSMGVESFSDCIALTDITWPSTTPVTLGRGAFTNTALTSITLPDNVSINNVMSVFSECASLESANLLLASGEKMENGFLANCRKLSSVKLPTALTYISQSAFMNDEALKSLIIPSSVTTIEPQAFLGCALDLKLYLNATSVPSGYESDWNILNSTTKAEYLLYSETQPTTSGTQRYWHYDTSNNPVIWTVA
jgi:hypothetical protein